jgi:hypothetical protein
VKPQIVLTIGIDHPLTRGLVGVGVLNEIARDVIAVLDEIEAAFFLPN